ncbi:PSP1-like protein [Lachnospiraceae bacterium JC7]|nr:PSP1-like protein [Lachnospiraceae bacterium JC7]
MTEVIGVRFRTAGKIYYFAPGDIKFVRGDHAIVETARGVEYGFVVMGNRDAEDEKIIQPLKPVIRKAVPEDDVLHEDNKLKEKEAFKICQEKIHKHNLEMKLIDVEYTFDRGKVLFYFTADGRVDFRALVKDLASIFRTRIELRQVGVRDETKILGGYGTCGRPLCCHTFLSDFAPVSIRMAKEQGLSLNPANISGVCGRLMCCLKNEEEVYEFLNSRLPSMGDYVTTPDGLKGEVTSVSVLNQKVKVIVNLENEDEKELREYKVSELKFKPRKKNNSGNDKKSDGKNGNHNSGKGNRNNQMSQDEEDIEALEKLERSDPKSGLDV